MLTSTVAAIYPHIYTPSALTSTQTGQKNSANSQKSCNVRYIIDLMYQDADPRFQIWRIRSTNSIYGSMFIPRSSASALVGTNSDASGPSSSRIWKVASHTKDTPRSSCRQSAQSRFPGMSNSKGWISFRDQCSTLLAGITPSTIPVNVLV